jgi:dihydrofolate synthase / folylpolyglutamate synthase
MNYQDALSYLYSLINYEVQRPGRYAPDVVSLDRPRALLARLGDPQEKYPILHVTGTKGKGSVSAMCASVLQAAGLRVGLYSSPNLQDFRERYRVNNELIDPDVFADLVTRIKPHVEHIPGLTWFEVITAVAFLYFHEAKVDVAVIEVGLGGRLDATNIIHRPVVSTITSLSYDHTNLLGNTLAEIAFEKAGIIKPNRPVVSAPQTDEAREVLERIAAERAAPMTLVGRDVQYATGSADGYGQHFTAHRTGEPPQQFWTPLLGEHQVINAAVALAALYHARAEGLPISDDAIRRGFSTVNWAGRLEVVGRAPYLILDSAHNGESASRLCSALQTLFLKDGGRLILVFGASSDKDVLSMFRELLPATERLIVVRAANPRAFSTEQLADIAAQVGYDRQVDQIPATADALRYAEQIAAPNDVICVTGSLFVVGEVRNHLGLEPARAAYMDQAEVQRRQS